MAVSIIPPLQGGHLLINSNKRRASMSGNNTDAAMTAASSAIWMNHVRVANTPDGFTVRTTVPANPDGVDVMLEQWQAGSEEPPHSHPGDDMTVVVEGKMAIQFYTRTTAGLVPDGDRVMLGKGDVGYIRAGRIHDARYIDACKLVYVHDNVFGFIAES
jgi:quercetin dioxygenase-like cupin family protein